MKDAVLDAIRTRRVARAMTGVRPEAIVCLGHAAPSQPPAMRRKTGPDWGDQIQWERG